jgi:hypothetical protein
MSLSDQIKSMQRAVIKALGDGDEKITFIQKTAKGVVHTTYLNVPCIVSAFTADDVNNDQVRDVQKTKYFRFTTPTGATLPKRGDVIVHDGQEWMILGAAAGHGDCFKWRAAQDKNLGIGGDKVNR